MEAISNFPSNPVKPHINPCRNHIFSRFSIDSRSPNAFRSFRFSNVNASLNSVRKQRRPFPCCCNLSKTASLDRETFDVVVVGAGIIGLTIARQLLLLSDLSVAVVDAKMPCYGATGAGQGYIWMTHKTPGSDRWELSMRSKQLWGLLADSIQTQGMDPSQVLGWKKTGSLLLGRTPGELAMLENRVKLLSAAGLRAEYLSVTDLLSMEPALEGGNVGGAAFLPDDCQLDAHRTVEFIEKGNKYFASDGRYAEFYHNPVISLLRSAQNGEVEGVRTSKKMLYSKCALVIAAGAWSGSLMQSLLKDSDIVLDVPVKPRKGHLLVLENFNQFELKHGLMEAGYADHKIVKPLPSSASGVTEEEQTLTSISMTATTDSMGNLVLGSSRQFTGFSTDVEESIINRIWERAGVFFPTLRELSLPNFVRSRKIRVGLRPYMIDGKPLIGPIPGIPKVFLATGHEGEGLCTALGTAEMIGDMILGNTGKVDWAPFSVQGRCCT